MKTRPIVVMLSLVALALLALGGFTLYDFVVGSTLEASEPIRAAPLELHTRTQAPVVENTPTAASALVEYPTPAAPTAAAEPTAETAAAPALQRYAIASELSQARFTIYEELNGVPTDVVGVTNQVAGEAGVNLADLSQTLLGEIRINARTLVTDQDRRNQAIRNRILTTDQYEYITFLPVQITGLTGSTAPGQEHSFQVVGDLTVRDVTLPVTFQVTVSVESVERLVGRASAVITQKDFKINVPSVPFVANVGEDILLEIDFVLLPAGE
jgi:polyisoprenoid-binding protein YceI